MIASPPPSLLPRTQGHARACYWLLVVAVLGCSGRPLPPSPPESVDLAWAPSAGAKPWNVILLTLDTTRRDALGCYGNRAGTSPSLDSLAQAGVVFERAFAAAPMTLPSHATILSGLDPQEHGVRDNGHYVVPDGLTTLAERFAVRGYETAAFVSAFPVDAQFGLDQGFAVYDDDFDEQASRLNVSSAERRARRTTDAALRWLGRRDPARPLFLWVHYFDPHEPYDPPAPFAERFEDPYLGEVAAMDHEVGRLFAGLRARGILASSFVVAVGDHGESRGEHGERTHAFFVYDATQAVPCLLALPETHPEQAELRGVRVEEIFRLKDLAPTLGNLLGWEPEEFAGQRGTSGVSLLRGGAASVPVAYMETFTPFLEYGWSDLRAVRAANWKYIRAPRPELYDLDEDPGETENVLAAHPDVAAAMERWLDWYLESEAAAQAVAEELDPEVVERLRSLGYLQGGGAIGTATMADPKDRLEAFEKVGEAQLLAAQYRNDEAIRLFESVVREDPENATLLRLLAATYAQARQWEDAARAYDRLLHLAPTEPRALREAAQVATFSGDLTHALELLDVLEQVAPEERVWKLRGEAQEFAGDRGAARAVYEERLAADPSDAEALVALARTHRADGGTERAGALLRRATTLAPASAEAWAERAELAFADGKPAEGDTLLARALAADPRHPGANFRLGWRQSGLGNAFAALDAYERAVAARPDWVEARVNLGNALVATQQPALALPHFATAIALGGRTPILFTNQGVAFAQLGQLREAITAWEQALALGPDPQARLGLERNLAQARQQLGRS